MKKLLIFFCFFLGLSSKILSSEYQWVQVLNTDNGNIFFIDKISLKKEGDEVSVKVVGFDRGKVKLSMKQASA